MCSQSKTIIRAKPFLYLAPCLLLYRVTTFFFPAGNTESEQVAAWFRCFVTLWYR